MGKDFITAERDPGEYSHRSSRANVLVVYRLPAHIAAQNPQD